VSFTLSASLTHSILERRDTFAKRCCQRILLLPVAGIYRGLVTPWILTGAVTKARETALNNGERLAVYACLKLCFRPSNGCDDAYAIPKQLQVLYCERRVQQIEHIGEVERIGEVLLVPEVSGRQDDLTVVTKYPTYLGEGADRVNQTTEEVSQENAVVGRAIDWEGVHLADLESHALLNRLLFLGQAGTCPRYRFGVRIDARHEAALATEQDRGNPFATAGIEDLPTPNAST
jgi:hypothetical protein